MKDSYYPQKAKTRHDYKSTYNDIYPLEKTTLHRDMDEVNVQKL